MEMHVALSRTEHGRFAVVRRRPRPTAAAVVLAVVLAVGCAAAALVTALRLDGRGGIVASWEVVGVAGALALVTLGAVLVIRSDVARIGWVLVAAGGALALLNATYNATVAHAVGVIDLGSADLAVAWVQHWLYPLPDAIALGVLPLLLPDGAAASRRWRVWLGAVTALTATVCMLLAVADGPLGNAFDGPLVGRAPANPLGLVPATAIEAPGTVMLIVLALVVPVASAVGLAMRARTGDAVQRRQLGWIGLGVLAAIVLAMVEQTIGWLEPGLAWPVSQVTGLLALVALVAALAAALLRYRLWDVDLVVTRTAVGLVMTGGIVVVYAAVVVAVGELTAREGSVLPGIAGAASVAVAAHPLRVRAQRVVNRLMFGDRDDPYTVLSSLGRTLSRAPGDRDVVQQLADSVAAALRSPYVAVELDGIRVGESGTEVPAEAFPLRHQGELVGELFVAPRTTHEKLSPRDRHLLQQVADQAGPAVHATQLDRAARLARGRLAAVREEERRRLRRDLHDGVGPTLAGHSLTLERAIALVACGDPGATAVLEDLHDRARSMVAEIRALVHELRPPALDELGLGGALHTLVDPYRASLDIAIRIDAEAGHGLPAAVEVAVYRIVAEAVTNVARHAGASRCEVHVAIGTDAVSLRVSDDGRGRDGRSIGTGTATMAERADELGGNLVIVDREGGGTVVTARLPLAVGT